MSESEHHPVEPFGDFTGFFDAHATGLVRLGYLLIGERQAAEDVVQDVLTEMYKRWPTLHTNPLGYARTAVVNGVRSVQRRRAVAARLMPKLFGRSDSSELSPDRIWVHQAVQRLPQRQREVVVLRYWLDLSEADIAATLGISPGTVKSNASRALASLQASMTPAMTGLDRAEEQR